MGGDELEKNRKVIMTVTPFQLLGFMCTCVSFFFREKQLAGFICSSLTKSVLLFLNQVAVIRAFVVARGNLTF